MPQTPLSQAQKPTHILNPLKEAGRGGHDEETGYTVDTEGVLRICSSRKTNSLRRIENELILAHTNVSPQVWDTIGP